MSLLPLEAVGNVQVIARKACWFSIETVIGSNTVEVWRSTWLKDNNHRWLQPLWDYLGDRQSIVTQQETFESDDWMHSWVEYTVYEMFESRRA